MRRVLFSLVTVLTLAVLTLVLPPGARGQDACADISCPDVSVGDPDFSYGCWGECRTPEGEGSSGGSRCVEGAMIILFHEVAVGTGCETRWTAYQCADGQWHAVRSGHYGLRPGPCSGAASLCILPGSWEILPDACYELTPPSENPCEPLEIGPDGVSCHSRFRIRASVSLPCLPVVRQPYPRGLVALPNRMVVLPGPDWVEGWSEVLDRHACLERGLVTFQGRKVRNFQIGVALGLKRDVPPIWRVEDSGTYSGWSVLAIWERASYGKPRCGPGLQPGIPLPAYRVTVETAWQPYYRIRAQLLKPPRTEEFCAGCSQNPDDPYDPPQGCQAIPAPPGQCYASDGCTYVRCTVECPESDDTCWEPYDSGWVPLNPQAYGYPYPYIVSRKAGDARDMGACRVCVPVIEVQGLISNPR